MNHIKESGYPGGLLSTGMAAKALRCSISRVRRIPEEELPYIEVGNRRRYEPEDIRKYLMSRKR